MLCLPPNVSVASLRFLFMEKELSQTFHPFTSTKIVRLHLSHPVVHDLYSIMNVKQFSQLFHQCFSILQEFSYYPINSRTLHIWYIWLIAPIPHSSASLITGIFTFKNSQSAFFDAILILSLVVILMYAEWCVWLPLCLFIFVKKSPCHIFSTPLCVCRKFLPVTKFLLFVSTSYRVSCEIQGFRGIIGAHLFSALFHCFNTSRISSIFPCFLLLSNIALIPCMYSVLHPSLHNDCALNSFLVSCCIDYKWLGSYC